MVDNNVEEFFEVDVGYEQQVGGDDGVYPVHAYDVNCVLNCMSAAKRRQWRLQAKVKNTRQRIPTIFCVLVHRILQILSRKTMLFEHKLCKSCQESSAF